MTDHYWYEAIKTTMLVQSALLERIISGQLVDRYKW